jgi:DNA-binding MarR family transcriptional regulator
MDAIKKLLRLEESDYYETHLALVNCVLPVKMTPMELKVLAGFMGLKGDIALIRFGPSGKKIIMQKLDLSTSGMSNYITQLQKKGFLIRRGDVMDILPILIPNPESQTYLFKLENISNAITG